MTPNMKKQINCFWLGADMDRIRRHAAALCERNKLLRQAIVQSPTPKLHVRVMAAWSKISNDKLTSIGDGRQKAPDDGLENFVAKVIEKSRGPDQVKLNWRAISNDILVLKTNFGRKLLVERGSVHDRIRIELDAGERDIGVGVSGEPLKHATSRTACELENTQRTRRA